jgi:hypothetical protein
MADVSLADQLRQADAQVRTLRVQAFKRLRPGLICGCEGCRRVGRKMGQGF